MSWEILQHFTAYNRDLLTKIFCLQIQKYTEGQILSLHKAVKLHVWRRDETLLCVHVHGNTLFLRVTWQFCKDRSVKEMEKPDKMLVAL